MYDGFSNVSNDLTVEILAMFKTHILKDELTSFVRVQAEKIVRGKNLVFLNVPNKNKEEMIGHCFEDRN